MIKRLLSHNLNEFIDAHLSVLLLRIGAGALIFTHGLPKLIKVFSGDFSFADPIGLGPELSLMLSAFAEGICALLIIFGLFTRYAAIPLILNFIVVFFIVHGDDPFGRKELPLFFLLTFVTLFFTGGGKYSLDKKFLK